MKTRTSVCIASAIAGLVSSQFLFTAASRADDDDHRVRHVLLLSIDGFHQHDLANCMQSGSCPNLAGLAGRGVTYSNARTTTPSDSFPGLLAQLTGGTPKTTGVYYDDSYDRTLFSPDGNFPAIPAGCSGNPGSEMVLDESIDFDSTKLFSGGINPAFLPNQRNADGSCTKVFPHDFLKVNTIFGVAHHAGLLTAWSDKHPAYDIVNGPFKGTPNVDDLYTPRSTRTSSPQPLPALPPQTASTWRARPASATRRTRRWRLATLLRCSMSTARRRKRPMTTSRSTPSSIGSTASARKANPGRAKRRRSSA